MPTKIKSQKPISLNVHLKYRCPNTDCVYEHWLSLLEAQTKNFKVVCECGMVFKPKTIDHIQIKYRSKIQHKKESSSNEKTANTEIIKKAIPSLVDLGFTKQQAAGLIEKAYIKEPTDDLSLLIKNTLLEIRNNG